jgi:hypothetical protein
LKKSSPLHRVWSQPSKLTPTTQNEEVEDTRANQSKESKQSHEFSDNQKFSYQKMAESNVSTK